YLISENSILSIASAISLAKAPLFLKCQYKAGAYTFNLLTSFLRVTPSIPLREVSKVRIIHTPYSIKTIEYSHALPIFKKYSISMKLQIGHISNKTFY